MTFTRNQFFKYRIKQSINHLLKCEKYAKDILDWNKESEKNLKIYDLVEKINELEKKFNCILEAL